VDYAKKHIDPAHPKSGPYSKDAEDDPAVKNPPSSSVVFGGSLASFNTKPATTVTDGAGKPLNLPASAGAVPAITVGSQVDVSA
jgi:hypothetical protein